MTTTYIIDQRATSHMYVFPVQRILQELDHVVADSPGRAEAFGPCEDLSGVYGGLFDGETES